MYKVINAKSKGTPDDFSFVFKDFKKFYEVADILTYSLFGTYKVKVETDDLSDILDFISKAHRYEHLDISIFVSEKILELLSARDPNVSIASAEKGIDIFKKLVSQNKLLFAKGSLYVLYNSIPHTAESMQEAVDLLKLEYGTETEITDKMLSKHFILNDTVYPRQVLIAFLWQDRWRWNKLAKSVRQLGNDVVKGSFVKNLKSIIEEKNAFYKTGECPKWIKSVDIDYAVQLYKAVALNNRGFNDLFILLKLFERGMTVYDLFLQR